MSYPEPRYLGEKGEINAVFRAADTPPDIVAPNGTTTHKVDMGPKAPGARTHFHRSISESFYVLSGEVELYNGERWVTGRQGDFLYVPVGGLHAFKNDSDDPVSMLMLFSPGAPREEYFERVAEFAQRGGEELREFQVRHDSFFV